MVLPLGAGCTKKPEPKLDPKVGPPVIGEAGTLRAGVDLALPPFGGIDGGKQAGIDIDVASALAERLGLAVTFVDVAPSQAATALAEGKVDVVLSVPLTNTDLTRVTPAGTYISDGPGIFGFVADGDSAKDSNPAEGSDPVEPSMTLETLPVTPIAAQKESSSYWLVELEYGTAALKPFETLREALESVDRAENEVAVGSAVIGAYISRDMKNVQFLGQLAPTAPLTVAVSAENAKLGDAVRLALNELDADGVLDSIRRKWVGNLPALKGAEPASEPVLGPDPDASDPTLAAEE